MRGRKILLCLGVTLVLGTLAYTLSDQWLPWLGQELVRSESPQKAEMIVVLGGDERGGRIMAAARLIHQGWAPQALISGAGYIYGYHESDLAVDYAARHGESAAEFVKFPYPAFSTREEARAVADELRRMHVHKILVVTSNFHTRRAARVFRNEVPDLESHVISSGDANFKVQDWWRHRESRKVFLEEYLKTAAYAVGL